MVPALDDDQGNFVTGGKGSIVFDLKGGCIRRDGAAGKASGPGNETGRASRAFPAAHGVAGEFDQPDYRRVAQTIELKAAPQAGEVR